MAHILKISALYFLWYSTTFGIVSYLSRNSDFFKFGPSETLIFFHAPIDTWPLWSALVAYTIISNIFCLLGSDIISPYCTLSIQNTDAKLKHSVCVSHAIIQFYYLGYCISGYLSMYMLFTQIDFLIIETVIYGITTYCTTYYYIKGKRQISYNGSVLRDHVYKPPKKKIPKYFDVENFNYSVF